jgi:hypothetical protein
VLDPSATAQKKYYYIAHTLGNLRVKTIQSSSGKKDQLNEFQIVQKLEMSNRFIATLPVVYLFCYDL